mgnify:CR=1 FL=1
MALAKTLDIPKRKVKVSLRLSNLSILKNSTIKASDFISKRDFGSIKIVKNGTTKPKEIISEIPLPIIRKMEHII